MDWITIIIMITIIISIISDMSCDAIKEVLLVTLPNGIVHEDDSIYTTRLVITS